MFSPKIIPQCTTGIFITRAFIIAKSQLFGLPTFAIEVIAWLNKNWLKSSHETGLIISLLLVLGKIPLLYKLQKHLDTWSNNPICCSKYLVSSHLYCLT